MPTLLVIDITLPEDRGEEAAAFLAAEAGTGWEELSAEPGTTTYRLHYADHDAGRALLERAEHRWPDARTALSQREEENWAMAWKDFFAPVACGERFEVVPPWLKEEADPGRTCIVIEPKMAFGTGHHATTALCLELIGGIRGNGDLSALRFLDLGTGSGILAIGLAMLGLTGLGLDIDPEAIPCAVENAEANGVADRIAFSVGELACLAPGLTFDVIAANILSGPLIELAESIAARLAPGGLLLLSGILTEQADAVAEAYVRAGLPEPERFPREEWCALRIRRPA